MFNNKETEVRATNFNGISLLKNQSLFIMKMNSFG